MEFLANLSGCQEIIPLASPFLILYRRFLSADLNFAFSALAENGGTDRAAPNLSSISQIVSVYEKIRTHFSANF